VRSFGTFTRIVWCEGLMFDNGFYGDGIVNVYAVVMSWY